MKNIITNTLLVLITVLLNVAQVSARENPKREGLIKNITWINNACVKLSGSKTVYFDPYRISAKDSADLILITHDHGDHLSRPDIEKIRHKKSILIGPTCVTQSIAGNTKTVKAGDKLTIEGVHIQVVPSYNINKEYHAKSKGHVGYVVTLDGVTYYHPGDADVIPEMKNIDTDVAFLPVCGTYMMSAQEAVEAAKLIKPGVVVPFHWGSVIGSKADAEKFKSLYSGKVALLEPVIQ